MIDVILSSGDVFAVLTLGALVTDGDRHQCSDHSHEYSLRHMHAQEKRKGHCCDGDGERQIERARENK